MKILGRIGAVMSGLTTATAALTIAIAPALALVTTSMLLLDRHFTPWQARIALAGALVVFAATVGVRVARSLVERSGALRLLGSGLGVTSVTAAFAIHPLQHLRSDVSVAARLNWLLPLEDNSRFVGVAREVTSGSPSGGELAEMFGTGFVAPALLLLRATAPGRLTGDPRVAAIDIVNLSSGLAIVLTGLIVLLGLWQASAVGGSQTGARRAVLDLTAGVVVSMAAIIVTVVIPMQFGFLSFIWGVVWLGITAVIGGFFVDMRRTSPTMAGVIVISWLSSALLMIGAWPFLIAGLLPFGLGLLPAPRRLAATVRAHPVRSGLFVTTSIMVAASAIWSSPIRTVLMSYGIEALTVGGSMITTPRTVLTIAVLATVSVILVVVGMSESRPAWRELLTDPILAPAAVGMSFVALLGAAAILTDGVLGYAGPKLLHGFAATAFVVALPRLVGAALRARLAVSIAAAVSTVVVLGGPIDGRLDQWAAFARADEQPHAVAIETALQRTAPDVPIRCVPPSGRPVTEGSRWATYFCINWAEDAFNEDRFHGYRGAVLRLEDDTFEHLIERMMRERMTEYTFAYRFVAGSGWAGWNGTS